MLKLSQSSAALSSHEEHHLILRHLVHDFNLLKLGLARKCVSLYSSVGRRVMREKFTLFNPLLDGLSCSFCLCVGISSVAEDSSCCFFHRSSLYLSCILLFTYLSWFEFLLLYLLNHCNQALRQFYIYWKVAWVGHWDLNEVLINHLLSFIVRQIGWPKYYNLFKLICALWYKVVV